MRQGAADEAVLFAVRQWMSRPQLKRDALAAGEASPVTTWSPRTIQSIWLAVGSYVVGALTSALITGTPNTPSRLADATFLDSATPMVSSARADSLMDSLQSLATQFLRSAEGERAVSSVTNALGESSQAGLLRVGLLLLPVLVAMGITVVWFVARLRAPAPASN